MTDHSKSDISKLVNEHEIEVLRVCCGEKVPGFFWGAWVTACLESLRGKGLVTGGPVYKATDEGRRILACLTARKENE